MTIEEAGGGGQADNASPGVKLLLGVGVLLLIIGIGLLVFDRNINEYRLMICAGLGITLAACGTSASGEWQGWTVTGSGAVAIVLFLILQYFAPTPIDRYKEGQIKGDFKKVAELRVVDVQPMYQYRDRNSGWIKFLLARDLRSDRLSIQVDTTEDGEGKELFEMVGDTDVLRDRYLDDKDAENHVLTWNFDYDKRTISDNGVVLFRVTGLIREGSLTREGGNATGLAHDMFSMVGRAFAQTTAPDNNQATTVQPGSGAPDADEAQTPAAEDIDALFDGLKADDPSVRRNARDELTAAGPVAVPKLIEGLRESPNDYRTRLGVSLTLNQILLVNPDKRDEISGMLSDEDFSLLVNAATDKDNTIKLQASEFLYQLADPRVVPFSAEAAAKATDEVDARNQIIIFRKAGQGLPQADKNEAFETLGEAVAENRLNSTNYIKESVKSFNW